MFKKLLIFFGIVLLVGFVSVFVRGYEYQVSKSKVKDEINVDSSQTPIKDVDETESTIKEETQTPKEEENNSTQQKEDTSITKPSTSATPKPSSTSKPSSTPKPSATPKPSSTPNNNSTSTTEQSTTDNNSSSSVEVKPWDQLGISEYDYYHKPAWSWQTIDFVLNGSGDNACSSREDCRKKCQEYGDKYLSEHDGSYNCDTVNSYSGDYLGEDFSFIEL